MTNSILAKAFLGISMLALACAGTFGSAQAIEINPKLMVHLRGDSYLTLGGTLLWLNGVSEAGAHYRTVTTAGDRNIRDNGSVLFYGGTARIVIPLN